MDEFVQITGNHTKVSGDKKQLFALLDCLCAASDVELGKEVGGVGLYGVDRHEKLVGDLLVGESLGHELQNLVFAFADAEFLEAGGVKLKVGDRYVDGLSFCKLEARPDAEAGEDYGEDARVEFDGEVADDITVLEKLESEDQCCQGETVEDYRFSHRAKIG